MDLIKKPVGVFDQFYTVKTVSDQNPRELILWDLYFHFEIMLERFNTLKSMLNHKSLSKNEDVKDLIRYVDDLSDEISIVTKHLIILQTFDKGMGINQPLTIKFRQPEGIPFFDIVRFAKLIHDAI